MQVPPAADLLARVRALPAAQPLLEKLAGEPGEPGVHLVGGAVRDLLLGRVPGDLDLVVEGDAASLADRLGGRVRVHDRFGTSTVELDRFTYDIARARTETYAHPGALPDVSPATIAEDLGRRDFTVNAAAIALGGGAAGSLLAVPGALDDLDSARLRVLHDQSFRDDPTRLLRMARYGSRLGFGIEPHTLELARAALGDGALATVSGPRIGAELRLLAREPDPVAAVAYLHTLGLDQAIHPGFGIEDPELADRALALLPDDGRAGLLALAVAAHGISSGELIYLLDALSFEAADRDLLVSAATRSGRLAAALEHARRPSEIAAAVGGATAEEVAIAGALGPAPAAREWLDWGRHVELEIDGSDLLAAGVPEGPAIGRGLRAALAAKRDGELSGREAELAEARRAASGPG